MTLIRTLRRWQLPITRSVVILFAASWLSFALQPCMAAGDGPAAVPGTHGAHHEAPAQPGHADHDCPHCPPAPANHDDCGTSVALDCDAIALPVLPAKDPDTPKWQPAVLVIGAPVLADACAGRAGPELPSDSERRPPDRPLQQRFCTYLK